MRRFRPLLLLIPTLLLFLAAEVAGRLLEWRGVYMPRKAASFLQGNAFLRSALVPDTHFRSGPVRIDVNGLGFRDGELAVPKPPGSFRIFAVGESTTFGWKGAESNDDVWPARLEALLRDAHPERRIEVVNAGVPGYTSVEQRINLMLRISRLEPDAILVYHGNNDLGWSWFPDVETKLVYGRESIAPATWLTRLLDHSYVFVELRTRADLWRRTRLPKHDEVDPAAMRMLRWNLTSLCREARGAGARVAIATFAHGLDEEGEPGRFSADEERLAVPLIGLSLNSLSPQGARKSFRVYNEMVREIAKGEGVTLVEIAPAIPPTPEFHTDWCHLTRKGEERMAKAWLDGLEAAGWWRDAPAAP